VYTLDAGASADNLVGSNHGRLGCAMSIFSPRNQKTVRDLMSPFFVLTAPPVLPSLEVSSRTIEATASEGAEFTFV